MKSSTAEFLGQSGFRFRINGCTIYIDPYLSDSVRELDAEDLKRNVPIPISPDNVTDADWILLTHDHIDHCDPHTIPKIASASPKARFMGPAPVLELLRQWDIDEERALLASEQWIDLGHQIKVLPVPAAHPNIERDNGQNLKCVGFVFELPSGEHVYHAGDTGLEENVLEPVKALGPYEVAILPVNEQNYFRARRGIIGNMTVREAFGFAEEIQARRLFPCHWDMFPANCAYPGEIRLIHERTNAPFHLLMGISFSLSKTSHTASIVIRTLNEACHLGDLLEMIKRQVTTNLDWEVILVDSGSTDGTVEIARQHGARIISIDRDKFSFGRSLNRGCEISNSDIMVFISGHCVPATQDWLQKLCQPIIDGRVTYCYGRQIGDDDSHFSERRIFAKHFPSESNMVQQGFFCNNANAALSKNAWEEFKFDEELTGLEDMELAKRLYESDYCIGYIADAPVFHHHSESWSSIRKRFEREAIALQKIMPEIHISKIDTARYILRSIWLDWVSAYKNGHFANSFKSIVLYRWNQYMGSYLGNHQHRQLSQAQKDRFFYPATNEKDERNAWLHSHRRSSPNESEQRAR